MYIINIMITILDKLDKSEFNKIESLLSKITIPKKQGRNNRGYFPQGHRATSFGMIKGRFNGITQLSRSSKKWPELYQEILHIGNLICPFEYDKIHLNNNVICPPHYDSKNVGNSLLISFGDYDGCNIVIEDVTYDAKHTPIVFNGSLLKHWNTTDLSGNKYSLVYYK